MAARSIACNDSDTDTPGSPVAANSTWHGTQTAGLLGAATNNATGMAGSGYDSMIVPARALGKCGGWDDDIIAAAEWAGGIFVLGAPNNAHPARVVNMSLGGPGTCASDAPAYVDALTQLRNKGVVVVAAAGNDGGLSVGIPANCKPAASDSDQTPIVIAVAALRHSGTKVGFSDIGPQVTVAAPGGNCVLAAAKGAPPLACLYPMLTTVNSGTTTPVTNGGTYSGAQGNLSLGTSFSTPLVKRHRGADAGGQSGADQCRTSRASSRAPCARSRPSATRRRSRRLHGADRRQQDRAGRVHLHDQHLRRGHARRGRGGRAGLGRGRQGHAQPVADITASSVELLSAPR